MLFYTAFAINSVSLAYKTHWTVRSAAQAKNVFSYLFHKYPNLKKNKYFILKTGWSKFPNTVPRVKFIWQLEREKVVKSSMVINLNYFLKKLTLCQKTKKTKRLLLTHQNFLVTKKLFLIPQIKRRRRRCDAIFKIFFQPISPFL